ncbi:MAG: hypothetical protein PGN13_01845 [Patulibacter minatonensis]
MSSLIRSVSVAGGLALLSAAPASAADLLSPPSTAATLPGQPRGTASAVTPSGVATLVFASGTEPNVKVYATSRPRGGAWSTPVQIGDTVSARGLQLSVSADGYAVAGWTDTDYALTLATRTPAGAWTTERGVQPPIQAQRGTTTGAFTVTALPGGEMLATWARGIRDSSLPVETSWVYQSYSRAARSSIWTSDGAVGIAGHSNTVARADAAGKVTLLAREAGGGPLLTTTRRPGGAWSAPVTIAGADALPSSGIVPELAVNAAGDAAAAWTHDGTGSAPDLSSVQIARRSAAGSWGAPLVLASGRDRASVGELSHRVYQAFVGLDAAGVATVAWTEYDSATGPVLTSRVAAATLAPGASTAPAPVNVSGDLVSRPDADGTTTSLGATSLAVGASGASVLGYREGYDPTARDFVSLRRAGAAWQPPLLLDGPPLGSAVDAAGTASLVQPSPNETAIVERTSVLGATATPTPSAPPTVTPTAPSPSAPPAPTPTPTAAAPTPTPAPVVRKVNLRVVLNAAGRTCPASVQVLVGNRTAKLPATPAGRNRCLVKGSVPQSSTARPGSLAFVLVSGRGVWPWLGFARVVAG